MKIVNLSESKWPTSTTVAPTNRDLCCQTYSARATLQGHRNMPYSSCMICLSKQRHFVEQVRDIHMKQTKELPSQMRQWRLWAYVCIYIPPWFGYGSGLQHRTDCRSGGWRRWSWVGERAPPPSAQYSNSCFAYVDSSISFLKDAYINSLFVHHLA